MEQATGLKRLFAGYAREERPLSAYAGLVGLFNASFGGFLLAARRSRQPLPERIAAGDLLLLGIATHKLSRLLAKDWVTSPFRAPFTEFQGPAPLSAEVIEQPRGTGLQRAVGELVT